jgi:hypothetical protein
MASVSNHVPRLFRSDICDKESFRAWLINNGQTTVHNTDWFNFIKIGPGEKTPSENGFLSES